MLTMNWAQQKFAMVETPEQSFVLARQGGVPSIQKAIKEMGSEKVATYIKIMLVQLNELLNLPRPLTENMIEAIAPMVVKKVSSWDVTLNVADVKIIFQRAIEGKYGKFYGGIGAPDVLSWFDTYICEKADAIEHWHQEQYHEERRDDFVDRRHEEHLKNVQAMARYIAEKGETK